ncbi:MAG TPA: signal peptidase I [Verrucomicrobiae bacterium]|nr:signal peptidase I [Verrucomicrobiae bacterium]
MTWKDRRRLKHARELIAGTRKLLRMHRDILDPKRIQELSVATDALASVVETRNVDTLDANREKLEKQLDKTFPRPRHAALHENAEVLLVALIVAMAVRTFFIQPFKIPTGSMQPTLFGIHEEPDCNPDASIFRRLFELVALGTTIKDGQCVMRGDHIFVDRFTYHFRKPKRGEVIVFDTSDIPDIPESSRGKFYIKRLIGLGDDHIEIQPPHVLVNGSVLDDRPAFQRIYSMTNGYSGYVLPPANEYFGVRRIYINSNQRSYDVPDHHLFVLGDNSRSSLDGRFWGSLPQKALVGRAVLVYWPFTTRFGRVD